MLRIGRQPLHRKRPCPFFCPITLLLAAATACSTGSGEKLDRESPAASPAAAASSLPRRLKIVTYNILSCRSGLEQIAKFLREQDADVICLQEVARDAAPASGPAPADPGRRRDQAVRLAEMLGGLHVVSATTLGLPADQGCNVAILSRYPIRESAAYSVEKRGYVYAVRATLTEDQPARGNAPASAPASQPAQPLPKQLHLFSVHLHSTHRLETQHIMESTRTRLAEVARLLDAVRELQGDLIVAGDFNATPWMPEYLALTQVLTDLGPKGAKEAPTFPAPHPSIRIDYVYGRGPLAARSYRAVNVPWSDHLPVVAEIQRDTATETPKRRNAETPKRLCRPSAEPMRLLGTEVGFRRFGVSAFRRFGPRAPSAVESGGGAWIAARLRRRPTPC